MKDFLFLNISFIVTYTSLFLFKTDIFMILFFVYMLIINFYYFIKIEKLKGFSEELLDMIKVWESAYDRQVDIINELFSEGATKDEEEQE